LAKMPEAQRKDWELLWGEVSTLLKKTEAK
jgi:hypothetical protein